MFTYFLLPVLYFFGSKAIIINFISNFVPYILFVIVIHLTSNNRGKKLILEGREQQRQSIHSSNVLK